MQLQPDGDPIVDPEDLCLELGGLEEQAREFPHALGRRLRVILDHPVPKRACGHSGRTLRGIPSGLLYGTRPGIGIRDQAALLNQRPRRANPPPPIA